MAANSKASAQLRILLGVGLIIAILILTAVIVSLPAMVYPVTGELSVNPARLTDKEKIDVLNGTLQLQSSFRAVLIQIVAGLAVVSAAALAWRQYLHTRREAVRQRQEKRQDFHLNLFGEALESLGADAPGLRIGGIYALSRLAEISSSYRSACADVLSTFIRTKSPWPPSSPRPGESEIMLAETGRSLRDYDPDVQTALTVLGKHTYIWHQVDYIRLRHLDLRRANLSDGHYEGVSFAETHLDGGWLKRADFNGAAFRGASLVNANLADAKLDNCNLRDVDLTGATLDGVSMRGAVFDAGTRWPHGFSARTAISNGAVEVPLSASAGSAGPIGVTDE
ncbi:pentapeptide repeat-containing protein [Actinocrispum wychmicini]|uniref:Pentapeptide repeat protein n=1 Tax=Actinocrispum wychmicini TaxID=1213861 RepID=A0A4V2S7C3_9PSEU|nr:pentapeptide repeat-containing protein [Actinocrispum wychmicini]TCO59390.1 pentapeptide repeat protein [Actinocrispum wychmicini]